MNDLEVQLKELEKKLHAGMAGVADEKLVEIKSQIDQIGKTLQLNQPVIDGIVIDGSRRNVPSQRKTLGQAIAQEIQNKQGEVKEFLSHRDNKLTLEIKTSGVLLTSDHLTGDPQATYGGAAIAPNHLINFRDLIKTTPSPTGTRIVYREGTVTNTVAVQTEGSAKVSIDYLWSEQKATSTYLAAKTKFSKQMMYNLPFLQDTLTRELLRDFYQKENSNFFISAAQAATGSGTVSNPTPTVDVEEIIGLIANQLAASFEPSFIIVDPQQWRRLLTTKPNDYSLPAATFADANGNFRIAGVPVIAAAWAQTDHALVIDVNQIERCETESLRVEFAFQNEDDWIKNLICARIECFEVLNILRPESLIYKDFSNS